MNVLVVSDYGARHFGAFAQSMVALARAQDEDLDIRFVFSGCGPHIQALQHYAEVSYGHLNNSRLNLSLILAALRLCRSDWKPDIVHVNFGQASLVAGILLKWLFGASLVWHIRQSLRYRRGILRRLQLFYYWLIGRQVDVAICISHSLRDHLSADGTISAIQTHVIYNGVNVDTACGPKHSIDNSIPERVLEFCRNHYPLLGMVANWAPHKDYLTLIEAFKMFKIPFPDSGLIIVGSDVRTNIAVNVSEYGLEDSVCYVDQYSPILELIGLFDIGILSSRYEGFGNAAVEYMLAMVPTIITACGGVSEWISENRAGIVIPVGDYKALNAACVDLSSDAKIREDLARRSKKLALRCFDMNRWVTDIVRVYKDIHV